MDRATGKGIYRFAADWVIATGMFQVMTRPFRFVELEWVSAKWMRQCCL